MVDSIPVIPRIQVTTVRKVDRKPDSGEEQKHKDRQAEFKKNKASQTTPTGQKGAVCDILL